MGITSPQVQLLRMMASQYKAPQVSISPVQNVGGGIAQGVGNIVNVLLQRQQQRQQMAQLDHMLEAQHQQNQADSQEKMTAMQPIAEKLGLPLNTVVGMDHSTLNNLLTSQDKNDTENQHMNSLVDLGLFNEISQTPEGLQLWQMHQAHPEQYPLSAIGVDDKMFNRAQQGAYAAMGKTIPGTSGLSDLNEGSFKEQYVKDNVDPSQLNSGTLSPELKTRFVLRGITPFDRQDKVIKDSQEVSGLQGIQQGEIGIKRGEKGLESDVIRNKALPQLLKNQITSEGLAIESARVSNQYQPALTDLKWRQGQESLLGQQQNNFQTQSQIDYGQGILSGQYRPSDVVRMQPGMSAIQGGNPVSDYNALLDSKGSFKHPYDQDPNNYFQNYMPMGQSPVLRRY